MPLKGILFDEGRATISRHAGWPLLQVLGVHHGSRTGTLYIGMTGFLDKRVGQHKSGEIPGFTKKYGCDRLLYYELYCDIGHAKRRERQLKGWRRERKIGLIEKMNPR